MIGERKGFTLIELLVVVVIIGILAGIAIPKFQSTKDKAKLAALRSDLANIRTAQEAYYSDYGFYASSTAALTMLVNPGAPSWSLSGGGTGTSVYSTTVTNSGISSATKSCSLTYGGTTVNDGIIVCP